MSYKIASSALVLDEDFSGIFRILRDEETDQKDLEVYFARAYGIFLEKLAQFRTARTISAEEERQFRFMLEALLAAKDLLSKF